MKLLKEFKTPGDEFTAPGAEVLRHNEANKFHPYVTHWRNDQDGGFYVGHYFSNLKDAEDDFEERCRRWRNSNG